MRGILRKSLLGVAVAGLALLVTSTWGDGVAAGSLVLGDSLAVGSVWKCVTVAEDDENIDWTAIVTKRSGRSVEFLSIFALNDGTVNVQKDRGVVERGGRFTWELVDVILPEDEPKDGISIVGEAVIDGKKMKGTVVLKDSRGEGSERVGDIVCRCVDP